MNFFLDKEIQYLRGVGPKKSSIFEKELNIKTLRDLLYHFPYRYIDKSKIQKISEINVNSNNYIQLKGKIVSFTIEGGKTGTKRLIAYFTDETGYIQLVWFQGIDYFQRIYKKDEEYIIYGKPTLFNNIISIPHPEIESPQQKKLIFPHTLTPIYPTTEKLKENYITSKTIHKLIENVLSIYLNYFEETLPEELVDKYKLMPYKEAILNIHFPENHEKLHKAIFRLKFEELFFIQLNILRQKYKRNLFNKGHIFSKVGDYLNNFYKNNLPFELTNAQKRVIKEIRRDLGSGKQMNRLLQGDVGSGKTLVALMSMLIAIDNGYQSCLMVPTEILANQHYNNIKKLLNGLNVRIEILTGSISKSRRNKILDELQKGEIDILIGTHALIEDPVKFKNLGLVVIDEQHRFGVAQRAKLWEKGNGYYPHILVMTATPIPRTLAMTLYGDLDVSVINELPPGRKPIQTFHFTDSKRLLMFGFIRKQIDLGKQVYVVYPMIKESEKADYKYLEEGYESFVREFPPPKYLIVCVHGKMKPSEKEEAMRLFVSGKAHILIATTVIEVGVDVPNASVMVIESAERFGLSQLHQLRGRVGRGNDQSYCILMTKDKLSPEAIQRINIMVKSNDGFRIAEEDLKLRGPGEIEGTRQSGMPFELKISNLALDSRIIQYARDIANDILSDDPLLEKDKNKKLKIQLDKMKPSVNDWSMIS